MEITDQHYSRMNDDEIRKTLSQLGNKSNQSSISITDTISSLEVILSQLRELNIIKTRNH